MTIEPPTNKHQAKDICTLLPPAMSTLKLKLDNALKTCLFDFLCLLLYICIEPLEVNVCLSHCDSHEVKCLDEKTCVFWNKCS